MDKILYLTGITRPGGAWESLRDILTTLDRGAFEPLLACSAAPAWSKIREEVRDLRIRMPMWRKRKNILRIPFAVARLRKAVASEHVTVVHANSIWDIPYALWAARPFRVPVVAHIRTEIDRKKARKYRVGRVDAAIATLSKCIEVLKSFSRLESRVHYVPNGANLERFDPSISGETVRHKYGFDSKTVVFGAFGRIDRTKGLDVLISAFSEVARKVGRAKLLLVGDSGSLSKDSDYGSGWKEVQRLSPDVELEVIQGAEGTYCVVTHPAGVSGLVTRFLRKHPIGKA